MTFKGLLLAVSLVLAILWTILYYPELIRRYYCPAGSLLVVLGGIYSFWTGRLVDEFGYEIKGRWVRLVGILGIGAGLWLFQYCPTLAAQKGGQRYPGQAAGYARPGASQVCRLRCPVRELGWFGPAPAPAPTTPTAALEARASTGTTRSPSSTP